MIIRLLLIVSNCLMVVGLAACSQADSASAISSQEDRRFAEKALRNVINSDEAALLAVSEASIRPAIHASFARMREALPFDGIQEIALVSANRSRFRSLQGVSSDRATLAYDIVSGSHHSLAIVSVMRQDGRPSITGLSIQRIDRPASEINAFRPTEASLENITILLLMIGSLATSAAAIARIWRSGLFRHKWVWTFISLLGVFGLSTFWGVPRFNIEIFKITFFPVGLVAASVWNPWWFATTLPVGAIATLIVAHRSAISRKQ